MVATLPLAASADVAEWEIVNPRVRAFSQARKVPETIEVRFGAQTVDPRRSWSRLSDDELGVVESMGAGQKLPRDFLGEMPTLMIGAHFKAGSCEGKPCKRMLAMDIAYVGD